MAEKEHTANPCKPAVEIRLLRADEIECRVGVVRRNGLSLLLYKDARVDQNILDETFGIFGWKREHRFINGQLFCTVSIRNTSGEWIGKEDVGTPSYAESEKGAASDSFKRACFNIGIGRELYTAPFIWIPAEKVRMEEENGKFRVKDFFHVDTISYYKERRLITALSIRNQRGELVYSIGAVSGSEISDTGTSGRTTAGKQPASTERRPQRKGLSKSRMTALEKEMRRTGVTEWDILKRYGIPSLTEMDTDIYQKAMEALKKTKDRAA